VLDFFKSLFRPAPASGETAKERLRLVLLSDHLSLAPDVVESLKRDLLQVISRYVEIDFNNADVTFEQRDREVAMLANIPITAVRERPRPSGDLPFATTPPIEQYAPATEPARQPIAPEAREQPVARAIVEQPVANESSDRPAANESSEQPVARESAEQPVASEIAPPVAKEAPVQTVAHETPETAEQPGAGKRVVEKPVVEKAARVRAAVDSSEGDSAEPQLELATAAPKPKPARSGNAAGSRRRRRKKYAAAAATAKAKHSAPGQQLGGQASAQA
jgi:cell division topological specificity factor